MDKEKLYPKPPTGITNGRCNGELRGIYVNFQDHELRILRPEGSLPGVGPEVKPLPQVVEMVDELKRLHEEREQEFGTGLYAHMVEPWVARQLERHANCVLVYIYLPRDRPRVEKKYSRFYKENRKVDMHV